MNSSVIALMLLSIVRLSAPVFIAGVGNMFCERVGILNLGTEGMMVSGAFCAVLGSHITGNPWIGLLCGVLGGALAASVYGVVCVEFGGTQAIAGLGLNMLALGLTQFLCSACFKSDISPNVPNLNAVSYTHLDVYKRQQSGCTRWRSGWQRPRRSRWTWRWWSLGHCSTTSRTCLLYTSSCSTVRDFFLLSKSLY